MNTCLITERPRAFPTWIFSAALWSPHNLVQKCYTVQLQYKRVEETPCFQEHFKFRSEVILAILNAKSCGIPRTLPWHEVYQPMPLITSRIPTVQSATNCLYIKVKKLSSLFAFVFHCSPQFHSSGESELFSHSSPGHCVGCSSITPELH